MVRTRVCIFCGGGPLTDEHILGTQIYKLLPPGMSKIYENTITEDGTVARRRIRPGQERGPWVAAAACRSCNVGWMQAMDVRTKPILECLMAEKEWERLRYEECAALASWTTKLSFCFEALPDVKDMVYGQSLREAFRIQQLPPENWKVWISGYEGMSETSYFNHVIRASSGQPSERHSLQKQPVGRLFTLVIGRLVLQKLGFVSPYDRTVLIDRPANNGGTIASIWPTQVGSDLTLTGVLDDAGLKQFVRFSPMVIPPSPE